MRLKQWNISFILAFLMLGALVFQITAQSNDDPEGSEDPTAVGLIAFNAEPGDNLVYLEWITGTEDGTAGFKIERSSIGFEGPFEYLEDIGFIPSEGGTQLGSEYEATDFTAINGEIYWYQLVEVEQNNNEIPLEVLEVFVVPPAIIPTPGNSGTNTPIPTSTDIPTITPIPSETSTVTPSATDDPAGLTPSAEPEETVITPTVTLTPRPAGPTPTQFVFPSPTPAGGVIGGGSVDIAAAAGPPAQEGYPASGNTATPFANITTQPQTNGSIPGASPGAYPANGNGTVNGGNSGSDPGSGNARGLEGAETAADTTTGESTGESSTSSRIILWLGLAGGLLILIGGIFFSIALASRRA